MDTLVNRVANSKLKTLNLEQYFPAPSFKIFDLKDHLFQGLLLREKEFRAKMKDLDWTQYADSILLLQCSSDAIIPVWAYSLVSKYAGLHVEDLYVGSENEFLNHYYRSLINNLDLEIYKDQMVVIKGCSDKPVPPAAYAYITQKLLPLAKSIMYGEACSTVPIYKKPRPQV